MAYTVLVRIEAPDARGLVFEHLYYVTADDYLVAQDIVKRDVMPGFEMTVLAVWEGHRDPLVCSDALRIHRKMRP